MVDINQLKKQTSLIKTFKEKKFYDKQVFPSYGPKFINFYDEKTALYGKVDIYNHPIYPKSEKIEQLQSNKEISLLSITKSQFNLFHSHYVRLLLSSGLNSGNILSSMSPKVGIIDVKSQYESYIRYFFELFNIYVRHNKKHLIIDTIDKYYQEMLRYYTLNKDKFKVLLFSSFIKSNYNSPLGTGLCIEINSGDGNDDYNKYVNYIGNNYFDLYRNTAFQYGFLIDKNVPWRLVLDITNPEIQNKLGKNLKQIINDNFNSAYMIDFPIFYKYINYYWSLLIKQSPYIKTYVVKDGGVKFCILTRKNPKNTSWEGTIDAGWWCRYLEIKLSELNKNISLNDQYVYNTNIIELSQYLSTLDITLYINKLTNTI